MPRRIRPGDQPRPETGDGAHDPIDLSILPPAHQERARDVIRALAAGVSHTRFKGKRLQHERTQISVPLGRHWRLMFIEIDKTPVPLKCCSHSDYNGRKPGRRR